MLMHPAMRMDPIAFVDDDPDKLRKDIYGVRILGAIKRYRTHCRYDGDY